jgi:hypothetical protein
VVRVGACGTPAVLGAQVIERIRIGRAMEVSRKLVGFRGKERRSTIMPLIGVVKFTVRR